MSRNLAGSLILSPFISSICVVLSTKLTSTFPSLQALGPLLPVPQTHPEVVPATAPNHHEDPRRAPVPPYPSDNRPDQVPTATMVLIAQGEILTYDIPRWDDVAVLIR